MAEEVKRRNMEENGGRFLCHYCQVELYGNRGEPPGDSHVGNWSVDHKIPRSHFPGPNPAEQYNQIDNLVAACIRCNERKGDTPYAEFMRKMAAERM
jgi:5-methylcytosine-specific restriction endonuclease McrA